MKRIITFLIAFGAFIAVQAQTSREEARRVILGQGNKNDKNTRDRDVYNGSNTGDYASKQAAIDQVNRDYDAQIANIRYNSNLSQAEKDRRINQLEKERRQRIKEINKRYNDRYDNDDRRDDDRRKDDKRYKDRKDNGKHLGWEKGKGNPHKNGDDWKKNKNKKNKKNRD